MFAKDYRQRAWDKLRGKWGTFALIMLIYLLITSALEGVGAVNPQPDSSSYILVSVFSIISFIIAGPFEFGLRKTALAVANAKPINVEGMFDGFKDFTRTFVLYLINSLLIFLWSLLLIIPGIIAALSYSMSYHILEENPNMSANEARQASVRMMYGHKWRYFCLLFSFIGWILLSILTAGILFLWVIPYMYVASAEFYNDLKTNTVDVETVLGGIKEESKQEESENSKEER